MTQLHPATDVRAAATPPGRRRATLAIAVLIGLFALVAGVAYAHLKTTKTLPADGSTVAEVPEVRVWFNQEPDAALSRLTLEGPGGEIALGDVETRGEKDLAATVTGELTPGDYTATWRTAGDDGHVMEGTWSFTVGGDR
jgi:methionine-rich copper-binding protein CopC